MSDRQHDGLDQQGQAMVVETIQAHADELRERFGVASLAVFGSASRGTMGEASDVDVLVRFAGTTSFEAYFGLKFYLEELLGRNVDLATEAMVKPRLWGRIEDELTYVA